uniref:hypothetical protein n=1 Tax=Polynucleobacter sp. TaxID=2029855 RepID=UPI004047314C
MRGIEQRESQEPQHNSSVNDAGVQQYCFISTNSVTDFNKCLSGLKEAPQPSNKKQYYPLDFATSIAICSLTKDSKSCMGGAVDGYSDTSSQDRTERRLKDAERRIERMEREATAKKSQEFTDKLADESKAKFIERMK